MSEDTYEGWTNRETWAVALHINNDQGWQESVHDLLRDAAATAAESGTLLQKWEAGEIIKTDVEAVLDLTAYSSELPQSVILAYGDIGSLWRVNWTELGAAFLSDLEDE